MLNQIERYDLYLKSHLNPLQREEVDEALVNNIVNPISLRALRLKLLSAFKIE